MIGTRLIQSPNNLMPVNQDSTVNKYRKDFLMLKNFSKEQIFSMVDTRMIPNLIFRVLKATV